jgi:hypothetical protein
MPWFFYLGLPICQSLCGLAPGQEVPEDAKVPAPDVIRAAPWAGHDYPEKAAVSSRKQRLIPITRLVSASACFRASRTPCGQASSGSTICSLGSARGGVEQDS